MNELARFNFNGTSVNIISRNDGVWFVAKDVCNVLDIRNSRDAVNSLDEDEKNTVAITDGTPGNPNQTIISESGFYKLVFRSRKPIAKAFTKWVTSEVLPAIRKNGGYVSPSANAEQIAELQSQLAWMTTQINGLSKKCARQSKQIEYFGNQTQFGTISDITGKPRTVPVRGYLRSPKAGYTVIRNDLLKELLFPADEIFPVAGSR